VAGRIGLAFDSLDSFGLAEVFMADSDSEKKKRFVALYEENYRLFFHVARKVVQNDAMAEDAVCEAVLRTLRKLDTIDEEKVVGYLARASRNIAIDMLKKGGATKVTRLPDDASLIPDASVGSGNIELEDDQASRVLGEAVMALSQRQRSVLVLRYGRGLSTSQIADLLESTPQTVANLHKRAIEALRQQQQLRVAMGVDDL
jgi:RNA polymerase sigma-70 factor, ECF subfamily